MNLFQRMMIMGALMQSRSMGALAGATLAHETRDRPTVIVIDDPYEEPKPIYPVGRIPGPKVNPEYVDEHRFSRERIRRERAERQRLIDEEYRSRLARQAEIDRPVVEAAEAKRQRKNAKRLACRS